MEQTAEQLKMAVAYACAKRIERYPDGPFVIAITEVLRAIGVNKIEELYELLEAAEKVKSVESVGPGLGNGGDSGSLLPGFLG